MTRVLSLIKQHKLLCVGLSLTILAMTAISHTTRLLICDSGSLPRLKIALVFKGASYQRGDKVAIKDHTTKYGQKKFLVKHVVGFPGDEIGKTVKDVFLIPQTPKNDPVQAFSLLNQTTEGKQLTPLGATVVPEGYVFVAGRHPRSFDSRYEEFGLIPIDKIWGKAVQLW